MTLVSEMRAPGDEAGVESSGPFERRWRAVWEAMERRGIEAIAVYGRGCVGSFGALQFLTGFYPGPKGAFGVIEAGRPPVLVAATTIEEMQMRAAVRAPGVIVRRVPRETSSAAAGALLEAAGDGALGFAAPPGGPVSSDLYRLRGAVGIRELVDATELIDGARTVKGPEDVDALVEAAAGADAAIELFADRFEIGMSEREAAAAIDAELSRRGALTRLVFVSGGEFDGRPPRPRELRAGEPISVLVEFAAPSGHWVEVGVIACAGELAPEHRAVAEACIDGLDRGVRGLVPGAACADLAAAMEAPVLAAGGRLISGLGHGTGIDEEPPVIAPGSDASVREGMAFALHPSARVEARDGRPATAMTVANTVLVGDGRPLSSLPAEILEVG